MELKFMTSIRPDTQVSGVGKNNRNYGGLRVKSYLQEALIDDEVALETHTTPKEV